MTELASTSHRGPFARLGGWCVRRRSAVVAGWIVLVVGLGLLAPRLGDVLSPGGFEITGSESHRVPELTRDRFAREYPSGLTAVIQVAAGADGPDAIAAAAGRIRAVAATHPDLVRAVDPARVAPDGRTGAVLIGLERSLDDVLDDVDPLLDGLAATGNADASVLITGGAAVFRDFNAVNERDLRRAEVIQAPIVLLILLLIMGSIVGATIPLLAAAVAMVTTFGALWGLARGLDLTIYVKNIVPLVGIGVALDYTLFMVARYREELDAGRDVHAAAIATVATAGRAVFFSGVTVIVALGAMATVRVPLFTALAVGATAVVAFSVAVALTLVPAALAFLGRRLLPRRGARGPLGTRSAERLAGWARAVMRRPGRWLVGGTLALLVLAAPTAVMDLGSSGTSAMPRSLPSIQAAEAVARAAGPGAVAPIRIIVDGHGAQPPADAIARLRRATAHDDAVLTTTGARPSDDRTMSVFEVIARTDEDDPRSHALVGRLRSTIVPVALAGTGATADVGGAPAQNADFIDAVSQRLPLVIGLVMGLTFCVLVVLFRSLLLPLKAVILTLLSVLAAYGVLVAVFQWGWFGDLVGFTSLGHVTAWVPPFLFCLLFGLSMDYEVFLITRIGEALDRGVAQDEAIAWGVGRSGRIITSAAAIMIVVFLSFVTSRLVPVKEAALGMAVAVLVDATVVRIVLVPAFMSVAGRWNWWLPPWLDRVLPPRGSPSAECPASEVL